MPETIIIPPIIAHTQEFNVKYLIEAFFERRCIKSMKQDGSKMYIDFDKIHDPDTNTISKVRDFVAALSKHVVLCYKDKRFVLTTQYLDL
jgi:hypothetical protein